MAAQDDVCNEGLRKVLLPVVAPLHVVAGVYKESGCTCFVDCIFCVDRLLYKSFEIAVSHGIVFAGTRLNRFAFDRGAHVLQEQVDCVEHHKQDITLRVPVEPQLILDGTLFKHGAQPLILEHLLRQATRVVNAGVHDIDKARTGFLTQRY